MKYIKKFNTTSEYESYMNNEPHLPNVSLVTETLKVSFTPAMGGG
jgi:hypothetical protein